MGAVAGGIGHDGGIIVEEGLTPMARTPEEITDLLRTRRLSVNDRVGELTRLS